MQDVFYQVRDFPIQNVILILNSFWRVKVLINKFIASKNIPQVTSSFQVPLFVSSFFTRIWNKHDKTCQITKAKISISVLWHLCWGLECFSYEKFPEKIQVSGCSLDAASWIHLLYEIIQIYESTEQKMVYLDAENQIDLCSIIQTCAS